MSKAQELTLGLVGLGAFVATVVAGVLFCFGCIGADAGWTEVWATLVIWTTLVGISFIPFIMCTVIRVVLRTFIKRA